jgi:hypothetical protein
MIVLLTSLVWAERPVESLVHGAVDGVLPAESAPKGGFSAFAFVQSRLSASSVETNSPFLDSQVVGRLGGTNGTAVPGGVRSDVAEFRTNLFLRWAPKVLDGRAALHAAFEVDFVHGDASYDNRGNAGGAFGADQVNLQTRRLNVSIDHEVGQAHRLWAVIGQQFVADGAYDPARARPDDLFRTGGGLKFFGSEAAGVTVYGQHAGPSGDLLHWRTGAYKLWEQGASAFDDVTLLMADAQVSPAHNVSLGLHAWQLRDRSGGTAGPLGVGASSSLSELQGGPRLDFRLDSEGVAPPVSADLFWFTADAAYNHTLGAGPVGVRGSLTLNNSWFYATNVPDRNGIGWLVDLEGRVRVAPGQGSLVRVGGVLATDDNPTLPGYGGVITGNSYGIVGAAWATHDTYLLFPDPGAINRQVAVVYDVSNRGDGLVAATASAGYDVSPDLLNVRVGGGRAWTQGFDHLGTEVNGRVDWRPLPFFHTGLTAAAVLGTDQPGLPWTTFGYLEWLVF